MTDFFRFPHTPHLAWLGRGKPRADKVLDAAQARELLSDELVVEEKVDGANLGFSVGDDATLRAQNRGSFLDLGSPAGQWKPLERWLATRRDAFTEALGFDLVLFGEWCYAVHSVRYDRLPDWFLVFDVYDREKREFWSVDRRNELTRELNRAPSGFFETMEAKPGAVETAPAGEHTPQFLKLWTTGTGAHTPNSCKLWTTGTGAHTPLF